MQTLKVCVDHTHWNEAKNFSIQEMLIVLRAWGATLAKNKTASDQFQSIKRIQI